MCSLNTLLRCSFGYVFVLLAGFISLMASSVVNAQKTDAPAGSELLQQADQLSKTPGVSPIRRIERSPQRGQPQSPVAGEQRTIDGSHNNLTDIEMNKAGSPLKRIMPAKYADGVSQMVGQSYPNPRAVSNAVNAQHELITNELNASDFLWQWGQFVDHDVDLSDGSNPPEQVNISIPAGDQFFDPNATGTAEMVFNRSIYSLDSGTGGDNPRQQLNEITGWIDGSQVYGSDEVRAMALRINDGTGRLRTSQGELLPFNTEGLPNAGGSSASLFIAGDVRANEQLGLTALHTLFMREHNRLAAEIAAHEPLLTGEQIYQQARRKVTAEIQAITYNEFLPALLGPNALTPYHGYNPNINAAIMNEFSTAAFRLGHTLVSQTILRLDANGNEIPAGHLPVRNAFFAPQRLIKEGGIEPILRGLASQRCQALDVYIVDDLRNFLFGPPGQGGFDLATLNIQRGRDHGLPRYNDARESMGLARKQNFSEVSSDPEVQDRLASVYNSVDDIDFWIGGLAEDHMHKALVGELFSTVLKAQFESLRDGDRFWYERDLRADERAQIFGVRLSDIIQRNTAIAQEISKDVFHVSGPARGLGGK
jgi:hypothetical protein